MTPGTSAPTSPKHPAAWAVAMAMALVLLTACPDGSGPLPAAPHEAARPVPAPVAGTPAPSPAPPEPETADCFLADVPLDRSALPDPGPATAVAGGVLVREVTFERRGVPMTLWIYTPDPMPATKLPCILITLGGSGLLNGVNLLPDAREEHLFYVPHGYAVVAYSQDGGYEQHPTMLFLEGVRLFLEADVGIANARAALDYAAAKLPEVDMSRIVAVGHSCAGTAAIQAAENDPRVAACVAYAPIIDIEAPSRRRNLDATEGIAEVRAAQHRLSPERGLSRLRCPTYLFVAEDDLAVPTVELDPFAEKLMAMNPRAKYVKVSRGGHAEAVEQVGMPGAIAWLATLPEIHPR